MSDSELRSAWSKFLDDLRTASDHIFDERIQASPGERGEAFRYLTQSLRLGFEFHFENDTPQHPYLMRYFYPTRKHAGDNANALYYSAWIDGSQTYRLVGNRGSAQWLVFSVLRRAEPQPGVDAWEMGEPYNFVLDAQPLLGDELQVEWDGSFEVILSPDPHPGNWIRTTPQAVHLRIRQFFNDWLNEDSVRLRIERVGAQGAPPLMSPERAIDALRRAGQFAVTSTKFWATEFTQGIGPPNTMLARGGRPRPDASWIGQHDANPRSALAMCRCVIEPQEALVLEFAPVPCRFWTLEFYNLWGQTVDYRWRLASLNTHQAAAEADGTIRVVLAHADPGVPNWIDVSGWREGSLSYRGLRSDTLPGFRTRLVKLAELPAVLPADTLRITPEARQAQIRLRAAGIDRRFRQ
ncbi:MAG: DUF1214 domain-containing protein [Gammaproteobacteria bacterium]